MQDRVIGLARGVLQGCGDVFVFEVWKVVQNLGPRIACRQQVQDILHADSQASDAGTATADIGIEGYSINMCHLKPIGRTTDLGRQLASANC